jgi:hypothetical protein
MPDIPETRFVFPLELDGNSSFGPANITHPFVKINFYNWVAQQIESQSPSLQKETIAQFFFSIPEQTIIESFSHGWDANSIDVNRGIQAGFTSLMASGWNALTKKSDMAQLLGTAVTKGGGWKLNDFVSMSYDNIDFRIFDYLFNLIPKSKEEAELVFKIIKKLKYLTSPLLSGTILSFPSICDVEVYGGNGVKLFGTLLSGVQNLSINYSPEGFMRTFTDGKPVQVQINLNIKELRRFTKENT